MPWQVEIDWHPSDRRLRGFALGGLIGLPLVAWIGSGGNWAALVIAFTVAAGLAGLGLARPRSIRPLYLTLAAATAVTGIALAEIALALVFFGLFLPVGLWFRLAGRDFLQRKLDPQARTYWREKKRPPDAASYLRQW